MSLSIHDPNCPKWYRAFVERKRVKVRKPRGKRRGTLCSRDRRNRTGCVGISLVTTKVHGHESLFFAAHAGGTNRKFRIDTLGREEAWRRALQFRAAFEQRATAAKNPQEKN